MFKKTSKYAYELLVPKIKKNLTRRRSEFEKIQKGTNKALEGLSKEQKVDAKSKVKIKDTVSKIGKIIDDGEKKGLNMTEKKSKGGRVGRRFGSPNPRKSNVQKITETFGPKKNTKKLSAKQMKIASLAGNKKKIDGPDFAKLRSRKV
jgi:hypothetical protein|tara:strand:- start:40 stop:483 length:444 start_codon:yes stop_codon:yes gene_type:complete